MKITMHGGAGRIGGNCVELAVPGARLILDLGLPLDAQLPRVPTGGAWSAADMERLTEAGVLPPVEGLYAPGDGDPIVGLVVSHAHLDHYGLASFARADIPVIAGRYARRLMDLSVRVMGGVPLGAAGAELAHERPLDIGPFRITPYLVDHSAFDAYAVLVEAGGRRILYSGDLRAHGRKASLFEHLVARGPRGVDALLLEGTTLSRDDDEPQPTEQDIERLMIEEMRAAPGLVLVWSSGQNIDRLVSVYRAALQSDRSLLIDPYIALVLDALASAGSLPKMEWKRIRVLFPQRISRTLQARGFGEFLARARLQGIQWKTVAGRREKYVAMFRDTMIEDHLRHGTLAGARLIYSMWIGYLGDEKSVRVVEAVEQAGGVVTTLHAGGHARLEDLNRLVGALEPKRVVPIHTLVPGAYDAFGAHIVVIAPGGYLQI